MNTSPGAALARLLLVGFTTMVDEVIVELERQGHPRVTATHEFALQAIDGGALTASELAKSLGVSKQAAAKTIAALEELHYLDRENDPQDARRKQLTVTPRGHEMMTIGSQAFDILRTRLSEEVGKEELESLERVLATLTSRPG